MAQYTFVLMDSPIVIVGAGSNTAASLIPMLAQEHSGRLILLTSSQLELSTPQIEVSRVDITNRTELKEAILKHLPGAIINLAAYTSVDGCEQDKTTAWLLNVTLVENLVRIARASDAHLVHISSDYVFDGEKGPYSEHDTPAPLNYYGKTKLAGENAITTSGIDATILRTNVVYGPTPSRPDFVHWVLSNYEKGLPFRVATDQYGNPTYVDDLAEAVLSVTQSRRLGLYHVGGADYVNRVEFAQKVASTFRLDPALIIPVLSAELEQAAKRPVHGGLVTLKAETQLGIHFRSIDGGLVLYRNTLFESKS